MNNEIDSIDSDAVLEKINIKDHHSEIINDSTPVFTISTKEREEIFENLKKIASSKNDESTPGL
jgi:ACT domain-containing protein